MPGERNTCPALPASPRADSDFDSGRPVQAAGKRSSRTASIDVSASSKGDASECAFVGNGDSHSFILLTAARHCDPSRAAARTARKREYRTSRLRPQVGNAGKRLLTQHGIYAHSLNAGFATPARSRSNSNRTRDSVRLRLRLRPTTLNGPPRTRSTSIVRFIVGNGVAGLTGQLLERQIDGAASALLAAHLATKGVDVVTHAQVRAIESNDQRRVVAVAFEWWPTTSSGRGCHLRGIECKHRPCPVGRPRARARYQGRRQDAHERPSCLCGWRCGRV